MIDLGTILSLVQFAIQEEPAIADALKNIFTKADPTPADWDAERAAWIADSYGNLVRSTQLTPEQLGGTPT